ncbi:maestro heat-like repeat-containing protein family member 2B isoform X1 [Struthio camelus]|uniref:maestro heat-like repeat-containing protein family member 2B isoform X1 n=1 Tax=Struthio camelus TaxID=8801 RepID=UPI003603FD7A
MAGGMVRCVWVLASRRLVLRDLCGSCRGGGAGVCRVWQKSLWLGQVGGLSCAPAHCPLCACLLCNLREVIQEEPQESPVCPRAIVAIEQLSKVKPHLRREENCSLLAQCFQGVICLHHPEQMDEEGETAAAAPCAPVPAGPSRPPLGGGAAPGSPHSGSHWLCWCLCGVPSLSPPFWCQGVHAPSLRALGQLMATLLQAEPAPVCFKDMVQVLRRWLTSAHACERERALQVCVQLLGAYEERCEHRRGHACEQFGSLVGLLGPLTCDASATSRWWAATCLGRLLQIGAPAKTTDVAPWPNEIRCLRERLNTISSESLLVTSANTAKVPKIVTILSPCLWSTRQSTPRGFALRAMFLLARSHQQPVLDSLLQKRLPTDSDTVELWRSLGRSALGCHILVHLTEKLRAAGKSSHGSNCCTQELGSSQAALEPHTITCSLFEVVSVLRNETLVQRLLPSLLPSLLGQVSETLGEEMTLSLGELGSDDTPGSRLFVEALELVLARCLEERWLRLLREQGVWVSLADPQAHTAGVCLLAR